MLLYVFLELDDLLELDDFLELEDLEEEDEEEPDEERLAAAITAFFGLAFAFTLLRFGEAAALPLARCVRFHSEPTI